MYYFTLMIGVILFLIILIGIIIIKKENTINKPYFIASGIVICLLGLCVYLGNTDRKFQSFLENHSFYLMIIALLGIMKAILDAVYSNRSHKQYIERIKEEK